MRLLVTGACGHIGSFVIEKIKNIKNKKKLFLLIILTLTVTQLYLT